MSDNVVEFEPRPEGMLQVERYTRREPESCQHLRGYAVNTDDRRVYCTHCGETIDPYEALLAYARRDEGNRGVESNAKKVEALIPYFNGRSLKIVRRSGDFAVSALGKTGQRVNATSSNGWVSESVIGSLASALQALKERLEKWTERELEYPRFTMTRRRRKDHPEGHILVGLLAAPRTWERLGCASDDRGANKIIRVAAQFRGIDKVILDDRPRQLWGAR